MLLILYNSHFCCKKANDFLLNKNSLISLIIQNHLIQLILYYVTKISNKITVFSCQLQTALWIFFSGFYCFVLNERRVGKGGNTHTHTHTHTPQILLNNSGNWKSCICQQTRSANTYMLYFLCFTSSDKAKLDTSSYILCALHRELAPHFPGAAAKIVCWISCVWLKMTQTFPSKLI